MGNFEPTEMKSATFRFDEKHLLYGRLRPYLNKALIPDFEGHCSSEIFPIRPKEELDRRYLFYWLTSDPVCKSIDSTSTGARMPRANMNEVMRFEIPFPRLEKQRRIVAVLDEAFEGLDRARAHAKGNFIDSNELIARELMRVFSTKRKGWEIGKIGDICTIKSGRTVPRDWELPKGEIPYVKVGDMNLETNLRGITTSTRFLKLELVSHKQIFPKGTTIFPKRGGAIMTNKKRILLKEICADLNVMGVIPGRKIHPEFLYHFFLSLDMREIGSGAAVPQINNYDIAPIELQYPSDFREQNRVVEHLKKFIRRTCAAAKAYTFQLEDLDDLRRSLLRRAFAGELT